MNNNQTFFTNPTHFWSPLDLASVSKINRTPSYEKLSLEEKVKKLENNLIEIQNNLPNSENCKKVFQDTIQKHINEDESKYDFFNESPDYNENNSIIKMMETLSWLSYTDKIKKDLLDKELEEYFN